MRSRSNAPAEACRCAGQKAVPRHPFRACRLPCSRHHARFRRLDRWFSLLFHAGRVAGLEHVPLVPEALDFIAAVLHERTDPRVLPGLESMMPGSAVVRLLNHPETRTESDLTVIAGDIERGDSRPVRAQGVRDRLVLQGGTRSGGQYRLDARRHEAPGARCATAAGPGSGRRSFQLFQQRPHRELAAPGADPVPTAPTPAFSPFRRPGRRNHLPGAARSRAVEPAHRRNRWRSCCRAPWAARCGRAVITYGSTTGPSPSADWKRSPSTPRRSK